MNPDRPYPTDPLHFQNSEDALAELNGVLSYVLKLTGHKHPVLHFSRFVLVLDSSFALADLRQSMLSKRTTALQLCLKHHVAAFLAPKKLDTEVYKALPRFSRKDGFAPKQWRLAWRRNYKAYITYLDKLPDEATNLVMAVRDRSDEPFVKAYEVTGADALLSHDNDIKALNVTPLSSPQFVLDLRRYAETKSVQLQILVGGSMISIAGFRAVSGLFQLAHKIVSRYPIVGIGAVLVIIWFVSSPAGQKKITTWKSNLHKAIQNLSSTPEFKELIETFSQAHTAEIQIRSSLPIGQKRPYLSHYIQRALAVSTTSLSLEELRTRVISMSHKPGAKYAKSYLRRVLKTLPNAHSDPQGNWSIGKRSGQAGDISCEEEKS